MGLQIELGMDLGLGLKMGLRLVRLHGAGAVQDTEADTGI